MRLVALTATKVEGDIVEAFVRHTLRFVTRVVVIDHACVDDTRSILNALVAEGLPITIWEGEAVTPSPNRRTENVRRALAEFDCDFLFLLDVDEFIVAPSRASLAEALAKMPPGAHGLMPMRTYVPTPQDDCGPNPIVRIRHRLCVEPRTIYKVVVNRAFADHRYATVIPGNHAIDDPTAEGTSEELPGVALAHFPIRSIEQLQAKAILGWPRFLAMGFTEQSGLARHWLRLNDDLYEHASWTQERFYELADSYQSNGVDASLLTLDPIDVPACRYPHVVPAPLTTAIALTRQLAQAYAEVNADNARLIRAAQHSDALRMLVDDALARGIPGDVFIAGARRGESAAVARTALEADPGGRRRVWIADSFEGPPPPTINLFPMDAPSDERPHSQPHFDVDDVRETLDGFGFLDDRVVFLPGWFGATLAECAVERIAVLFVDVGAYGGNYIAIESLFARIARGGSIVFANYGSDPRCRAAVDDFRRKHGIPGDLSLHGSSTACWTRM
jgi:hypothetical protein